MAEPRVTNQWQLQDTGESLDQWKLQDDEQRLPSHMELQNDYDNPEMMDAAWQPIDYRAMQAAAAGKSRRGGAALGALLVVALLGVGGYLAWFYMQPSATGTPDSAASATSTTEAAPTTDPSLAPQGDASQAPAVAAAISGTTTLTEGAAPAASAPGVTPAAALPETAVLTEPAPAVVAPILPATAEVRQAVINSEFGVNMRATAAATGALLATLDNATTQIVASGPTADAAGNNWYELALPDKSRGWVSGDFITVTVQNMPYADAAALLSSVGITLAAPESAPAIAPAASLPVTTSAPAGAPASANEPTIRLTGVISAPAGLNLRRAAETGDNVIELLASTTPLTVIGRSADGSWLQVELADKRRGWLSAPFINVTGDVNSIPTGTSFPLTQTVSAAGTNGAAALAATAPTTTTAPAAATAPVTTTVPAANLTPSGVFTVTSIMGVNVRAEPSNEVPGIVQLSWNTSGEVLGRTADNQWVRVQIPSGQSGWVAESAVTLDRDVSTLPVLN